MTRDVSSWRSCRAEQAERRTRHAAALLAVVTGCAAIVAIASDVRAQVPDPSPFQPILSVCVLPPSPTPAQAWPIALTDSLSVTAGSSSAFSRATLLANDSGTQLTVVRVQTPSTAGAVITGTDPLTYTPPPLFTGTDTFAYEISDSLGQTTVGLVRVAVGGDDAAPSVSISSPLGGTVSGTVTVGAVASDNVGVVGVRFFDGAAPIDAEVTTAPHETSWTTTLVSDGAHHLTAVARDAAGNTRTSAVVTVMVANGVAAVAPAVDKVVFSDGAGRRTTPLFSTTTAGELLVAFVASDGPASANAQSLTITGAGVIWTRVQRAAARFGVSEIWVATAPTALTNATVTSTQSSTGFHQSLTVVSFTGVSGVGASSIAGAASGAPAVSLVTQAAGSVVYAVGNDWDRALARTIPAGQTKVHEFVDTVVGDTFWVQAASTAIPAAATSVTLGATAPTTDQWNLAAIELKSGGTAPAPPPPPPPPPPAPAGPVLALSFNETAGTAAVDSSGFVNDGTIAGAARVSGKTGFGGALSFDGTASIVNVSHTASLALSTGMTLEAWVKPSANAGAAPNAGWRTIILKERGTSALAYGLYGNDGNSNPSRPAGYVHNGPSGGTDKEAAAGPTLPIEVWSHLAVTFDNASIRLYVNGVLRSTTAAAGAIAASSAPLRIGGNNVFSTPGTEFFAGLIDEVRVYNRALTAAEIATDMNTPLP